MRHFLSVLKIVVVASSLMLLASCAMNAPATKPIPNPGGASAACHDWCHNGWCSTHCENLDDGS